MFRVRASWTRAYVRRAIRQPRASIRLSLMYRHIYTYAGTATGGTSGTPTVCCARRANTGSLHGKHIGAHDGGGRGRRPTKGEGEGGREGKSDDGG